MPWTLRIHFSDGNFADETNCKDLNDCRERYKLAIENGYLLETDDGSIEWPPHSIVKCEYLKEGF